ncbi:MAG: antibiotic biosynthesis monooxygenase [Reyranella sp.]|nr:MAG: antibiotic biosynthesis monooxygenase [Reyranella sp.]
MERPMIDIVATQRIKLGMEAEAEALFWEVEAATLAKDKGCLRYEWYRAEEPGTYILLERWSDREAVQAHFKSEHMAQLLPKLAPYAVEKFTSVRLARLD